MASDIETFLNNMKDAQAFLESCGFTVRQYKCILDAFRQVSEGRTQPFTWKAHYVPRSSGRAVKDYVAVHLYASQTELGDPERRNILEATLKGTLGPRNSDLFAICLHYKD